MKRHIVYECSTCGKQSSDIGEIADCEAKHLGITTEEMKKWKRLKEEVKLKGFTVSVVKNEKNDKEFDDAIEELVKFEKMIGIIE